MESDPELKELIPADQLNLTPSRQSDLTLEEARQILQAVVTTPEHLFQLNSQLEDVYRYNLEEIRLAAYIVAEDIIRSTNQRPMRPYEVIKKETAEGLATLYLMQTVGPRKGLVIPLTVRVQIQDRWMAGFLKGELRAGHFITTEFPLNNQALQQDRIFLGFSDNREEPIKSVRFTNVAFWTQPDHQDLMKYVRCMFDNMNHWSEPRIRFPEELDRLQLPPVTNQ